ncbi:MAG: glycosyltransferase family 2 protein [Anaerolineales bacterium]|nr:glycosyltransferase family 2 protein [Anaerolineales bacterium]
MSTPDLSIILPVYNEAAGVRTVLQALLRLFDAELAHMTVEILAIDDGSTDDSGAQVQQVADARIRLLQHPYNIGNGAAVKTGIRHARGAYVLLMDADGQHQPADVPRLLAHVDRYDMVVGARTRESETAVHRDLANSFYNTFATYVCGRKIDDLTSGFRVIRADLAKQLVHLLPNTFSYPTTITLAVVRSGYSLKYEPIVARRRIGKSKIKLLRDGSRFLMILFKIATLYSPLKVFAPVSLLTFLVGFGYGLFKVLFLDLPYGPTSAMLMTVSGVIFLMGLVSEQITYLRYDETR